MRFGFCHVWSTKEFDHPVYLRVCGSRDHLIGGSARTAASRTQHAAATLPFSWVIAYAIRQLHAAEIDAL
jgi:hypothetical protein